MRGSWTEQVGVGEWVCGCVGGGMREALGAAVCAVLRVHWVSGPWPAARGAVSWKAEVVWLGLALEAM